MSRGMPNAALRNSVPRTIALPALAEDGTMLIHEVKAREENDFELNEDVFYSDKNKYWAFEFEKPAEKLCIYFSYSYHDHGQPNRNMFRRNVFNLKIGEIASLHINGRFTYYSGQWYKQHFVNIGYCDSFTKDLFVSQKPAHFIDKMDDLF